MKHIKIALALLGAFTALSLSSCGEKYYKVRFLNDDGSVLLRPTKSWRTSLRSIRATLRSKPKRISTPTPSKAGTK
jgi:hypothetical protein